jgi:hypothetical protein
MPDAGCGQGLQHTGGNIAGPGAHENPLTRINISELFNVKVHFGLPEESSNFFGV